MTVDTTPDIESALRHVKSAVRELSAYTLRNHEPRVKLNQNESPYDVPAELKVALWASLAARTWSRYPPFVASDFIGAVAEATSWPEAGILVGNGSNELIQALLAIVVERGRTVVIPEPTFTLYRLLTGVGGGTVESVALEEDLKFDVDGIIAAARRTAASIVVLCTPNNPTGSALSREEIEVLHDGTEALIVLDQAYVEFGGYDAIPLLVDRPRVVILRTFSKAMGMAGLRAGYLLGHPDLVREISKAKLPYNINFVTESIAAEVLRNRGLLQPQIDRIRAERERLFERMAGIEGIRVFASAGNFLLFRVEHPGVDHRVVFRRLVEEHGVLVRDVSDYPMLERCLRVSAGAPEENDAFVAGLVAVLSR
ncbi:MAG: histidinol-phosphate transaminase [Gemmatimonas sp.]|nr:histidinol-phosphate transaminase [Gemmatimonas sp.]